MILTTIRYIPPNEIGYDSKINELNLNISPGVAYNLTRCLQLEAGLQNLLNIGYSSRKEKIK